MYNFVVCRVQNLGESFTSLQFTYRIGRSTVGEIVHDTCDAIVEILQPQCLKVIRK